jgi:hypothetical protein
MGRPHREKYTAKILITIRDEINKNTIILMSMLNRDFKIMTNKSSERIKVCIIDYVVKSKIIHNKKMVYMNMEIYYKSTLERYEAEERILGVISNLNGQYAKYNIDSISLSDNIDKYHEKDKFRFRYKEW